jgi:hypothetical protein
MITGGAPASGQLPSQHSLDRAGFSFEDVNVMFDGPEELDGACRAESHN